ncbi:unnamed protein product [Urochloa humidicola]
MPSPPTAPDRWAPLGPPAAPPGGSAGEDTSKGAPRSVSASGPCPRLPPRPRPPRALASASRAPTPVWACHPTLIGGPTPSLRSSPNAPFSMPAAISRPSTVHARGACSSSSASTSQIRREKERGSQIRHGCSQIEPRRGSVELRRSLPPCRKGTPSPDPPPPLLLHRRRRWESEAASAPVLRPCLRLARVAIAILGFVHLVAAGIPRDSSFQSFLSFPSIFSLRRWSSGGGGARATRGQLDLAHNGRAD